MTRRTAGEGMIRERPNGLWEARYVAADGRKRSVYGRTRRETSDKLRVALSNADKGVKPVSQQLTTGAFLDSWLATVKETSRPRTHASYMDTVTRYVKPSIGKVAIAKLQPEHLQAMLADVRKRYPNLSPTTVRYAYTVTRIALGQGLRLGKVHRNVATLIDPPARVRREVAPMTADEARTFLASVAGDRHEALYRLAITSGLRQGELLGLRWSDVDLDGRRQLSVRHTLSQATQTLGETKTDRSRRTLDLDDDLVTALRAHRTRQLTQRIASGKRWKDGDYVFATSVGTPMQARNLVRDYHAALAAAKITRRPFHSLRHACATLLLEDGEELANVSKLLGHSSLSTTADFYAHLTPNITKRASDRMRRILAG